MEFSLSALSLVLKDSEKFLPEGRQQTCTGLRLFVCQPGASSGLVYASTDLRFFWIFLSPTLPSSSLDSGFMIITGSKRFGYDLVVNPRIAPSISSSVLLRRWERAAQIESLV